VKLMNARTDKAVASTVEVAETRSTRRKGLLGRDQLAPGAALVLTPCNAIHTVGMRFPIDVAFVDGHGVVRKIVQNLPPWRMALSPLSRTTIELAAGELRPETLRVGDRICLVPDRVA
jgi:uncharacterized membrane protein (UPF0127 family)